MTCVDDISGPRRGRKRPRERQRTMQLSPYKEELKASRKKKAESLASRSFYSLLDLLSDGIMDQLRLIGTHHYVNCIIVVDDKIVSGGADSTIKIWNGSTYRCETTLDAHKAAVIYLLRMNDKMLSCSADKSIKVWNTRTWQCERTLTGHNQCVYTLIKEGSSVLTASVDRTIKVWNSKTWECTSTETLPITYPP